MNQLPPEVIDLDHKYEREAIAAIAGLAELRWRYTLGPEGPRTFTEYAQAIGRSESAVRFMARGYETWLGEVGAGNNALSLNDCVQLMYVAPKDRPAVMELAAERQVSIGHARSLVKQEQGQPTDAPSNDLSITLPDWLGELLDRPAPREVVIPSTIEEVGKQLNEVAHQLDVIKAVQRLMETWLALTIVRTSEMANNEQTDSQQ